MKALLAATLIAALSLASVPPGAAADRGMEELKKQSAVIGARFVKGPLPIDPSDSGWDGAASTTLTLYPQVSVTPGAAIAPRISSLTVRALYTNTNVALRLEWPDDSPSLERGIGRFVDAMAAQWPAKHGKGIALPYIGMGEPGAPVEIDFWRAGGKVESLVAEGFGSLGPRDAPNAEVRAEWKDGAWRVVIIRTLRFPPTAMMPVAFAIWEGSAAHRDGAKLLSPWSFITFENTAPDKEYVHGLLWNPRGQPDPAKGRQVMEEAGCPACHAYPGVETSNGVGPDLTYAGGVHHPAYLRESIRKPSSFIVPGDGHATMEGKKKVSVMPDSGLTDESIRRIVDYLLTLH
ncbi:MAG: c-type cytochrome [Nitrospinae bacterium]|nr:c-type cytochrome [Nitrospinota bacterium]